MLMPMALKIWQLTQLVHDLYEWSSSKVAPMRKKWAEILKRQTKLNKSEVQTVYIFRGEWLC